jgi:hypothetical protein
MLGSWMVLKSWSFELMLKCVVEWWDWKGYLLTNTIEQGEGHGTSI